MGRISIPYTFGTTDYAVSPYLNENFFKLFSEFNGNIDDSNIKGGANIDAAKFLDASINAAEKVGNNEITNVKLNYTSLKVVRAGPTLAGFGGVRLARGRKNVNISAALDVTSLTVVFSTEADDGNPRFSSVPRVFVTFDESDTGAAVNPILSYKVTEITKGFFTAEIRYTSISDSTTHLLDWMAIGDA